MARGIADSSCGRGRANAVDRVDNVRPRLAEDDHQHRRLAIHITRLPQILHRVVRFADIAHPHCHSVAVSNHERLIIHRMEDHVVRAHFPKARAVRKMPLRHIRVCAGQNRANCFEWNAVFVQQRRVQLNAHTRQRASADCYLSHPGNLRQLLRHHRRCRIVHLSLAQHVRSQPQDKDRRIGRIDFAIARIARQVRGQIAAGGIDRSLHIARRSIDTAIEVELQRDARLPETAH